MYDMQLVIPFINAQAKMKIEEHRLFRRYLLKIPFPVIDDMLHRIASKIQAETDCQTCANCCKILEPELTSDESERLAILSTNPTCFAQECTKLEPGTQILFMKAKPCIFLQNSSCSVYSQRPDSCANYPHLSEPRSKFRMARIIDQYGVCPIVFQSIEALKEHTGFAVGTMLPVS